MEASYQTAALTASGLSWAAVAGTRPLTAKLENERTTPRATFRRGQLSLQSNEIFGRTNPIPERSRRRANCAQAFVAGPAVFPLYFQRAVSSVSCWPDRTYALALRQAPPRLRPQQSRLSSPPRKVAANRKDYPELRGIPAARGRGALIVYLRSAGSFPGWQWLVPASAALWCRRQDGGSSRPRPARSRLVRLAVEIEREINPLRTGRSGRSASVARRTSKTAVRRLRRCARTWSSTAPRRYRRLAMPSACRPQQSRRSPRRSKRCGWQSSAGGSTRF